MKAWQENGSTEDTANGLAKDLKEANGRICLGLWVGAVALTARSWRKIRDEQRAQKTIEGILSLPFGKGRRNGC